jgi:hypothetical protein
LNDADAERLRRELDELRRTTGAEYEPPANMLGATIVCQTYNSGGGYPTAAGRFYKVKATVVGGDQVENGAGTLSAKTRVYLALNLGARIPPHTPPTTVVVRAVPNRFVFVY